MRKSIYFASIFIWIFGLLLLICADYWLRQRSDNYYSLGTGEAVWFSVQTILALISAGLQMFSLKSMPIKKAILLFSGALLLGVFFYLTIIWLYITNTGIDSV